jgi:hypothetical protein
MCHTKYHRGRTTCARITVLRSLRKTTVLLCRTTRLCRFTFQPIQTLITPFRQQDSLL